MSYASTYKVVKVNGPGENGGNIDISEFVKDGYTPVGGVSATLNPSDGTMNFFQGMISNQYVAPKGERYSEITGRMEPMGGRRSRRRR